MQINLPRRVRVFLYILTAVGTPVIAFLLTKGIIDDDVVTLWSAEVAVVSSLAAFNSGEPRKPEEDENHNTDNE